MASQREDRGQGQDDRSAQGSPTEDICRIMVEPQGQYGRTNAQNGSDPALISAAMKEPPLRFSLPPSENVESGDSFLRQPSPCMNGGR